MCTIEVKITQNSEEVTKIVKTADADSLTSLLSNLQEAQQETNEYLTTLVEADKQPKATDDTKAAAKRKICEPLEGENGSKRSADAADDDANDDDEDANE